jgi:hypothetical protein
MLKALTIGLLCCLGLSLAPAAARAQDAGPKRWLCAIATVLECGEDGACERQTVDAVNLPPFVTVDLARKSLVALDGSERTSVIERVTRDGGRSIAQGSQGTRAWSATIAEETGRMSAAIADDQGVFALFGACLILPDAK